ncbi:MAG TPA: hypothetical protein VF250_02235 [Conexibacter sp.]
MADTDLLRVNPGGDLTPGQVVGRDPFVASLWDAIRRQSVVLTAERRMGKTSVLRKMVAEPAAGTFPIMRTLQWMTSPEEWVRGLLADTERALPGLLRRSLGERLSRAGVKRIDISHFGVEFEPTSNQGWKDVAGDTFAVLDREPDVSIVLLWDELPHMVAAVRDNRGPLVARELLDTLRALRETYCRVRMVFSGSLGLHHVVNGLRPHGGMWAPAHDMLLLDLPPLDAGDATYLAGELLRNERLRCDDRAEAAAAIADEVDGAPYYVHHVVHQLRGRQRSRRCGAIEPALVRTVVEQALRDPLDPWQLQHYVDRVDAYYGPDADTVKAVLDVLAVAGGPLTLEQLHSQIAAHLVPPSRERLRDLLVLVCKDHYLTGGPAYAFRLSLVRRAWAMRRGLA